MHLVAQAKDNLEALRLDEATAQALQVDCLHMVLHNILEFNHEAVFIISTDRL